MPVGAVNFGRFQAWSAQVQQMAEQTRAKGVVPKPFERDTYDATALSSRIRQLQSGVQAAVQFEKEMRSWTTPDNYRQIQLMVQSTVQQMRDSPIMAKQSQAAWLSNATAQLTNGLG